MLYDQLVDSLIYPIVESETAIVIFVAHLYSTAAIARRRSKNTISITLASEIDEALASGLPVRLTRDLQVYGVSGVCVHQ